MRALIIALLMLLPGTAFAQLVKPDGVPVTPVPGNVTIAVFASVDFLTIQEYIGVFEQHTDGKWYDTGVRANPLTPPQMTNAVNAAGGYKQYLQNVVLPIVNADILQVYYGQGVPQPPPAGSDPLNFLNYSLGTEFKFGAVNGAQAVVGK